jgi:two-component system NtrC family sensor kinase
VFRSLRFQLIAIVVGTVATVLAASQWVDTSLSERTLEANLKERATLTLGTVDSLWDRLDPSALSDTLDALVRENREIVAIDLFRLEGGAAALVATTRPPPAANRATPTADQARALAAGQSFTTDLPERHGIGLSRVAMPLHRGGAIVGAAQADLSLAEAAALKRRLRYIDAVFLGLSIVLISLLLAYFLERRVAHPVAALVTGMRRAEAGAFGARVAQRGGGEFGFLAGSFNRMLSRIEELTAGLESRVRRATEDLAEKNRELREANEKLWRAQLEMGRKDRLAVLGQLAATIAHELGTPLNSVLGYTQLLLREPLSAEHAEKLAIVESQIQRMIETIRSVLDRTRDRERPRAPVAIDTLIREAVELVSTRLAGRDITVRNEVAVSLPSVPGDAVGLRQVLLNLLTNAIDATDPPGTISVGAVELSPNGGRAPRLEIVVRDSGHGMTSEELRRVFEPFYTTKAPGRGTGLGLAIVDHVVRAHGGEVVVESAPERGTTMRVRLPLEA